MERLAWLIVLRQLWARRARLSLVVLALGLGVGVIGAAGSAWLSVVDWLKPGPAALLNALVVLGVLGTVGGTLMALTLLPVIVEDLRDQAALIADLGQSIDWPSSLVVRAMAALGALVGLASLALSPAGAQLLLTLISAALDSGVIPLRLSAGALTLQLLAAVGGPLAVIAMPGLEPGRRLLERAAMLGLVDRLGVRGALRGGAMALAAVLAQGLAGGAGIGLLSLIWGGRVAAGPTSLAIGLIGLGVLGAAVAAAASQIGACDALIRRQRAAVADLRAVGADDRAIRRLVLGESVCLGAAGYLAALVFALPIGVGLRALLSVGPGGAGAAAGVAAVFAWLCVALGIIAAGSLWPTRYALAVPVGG